MLVAQFIKPVIGLNIPEIPDPIPTPNFPKPSPIDHNSRPKISKGMISSTADPIDELAPLIKGIPLRAVA